MLPFFPKERINKANILRLSMKMFCKPKTQHLVPSLLLLPVLASQIENLFTPCCPIPVPAA